jgi:ferredoxin
VTAIFPEDDLPADWKRFTQVNAEWFEVTGLGSPGGAAQVGPQAKDHEVVENWQAVA